MAKEFAGHAVFQWLYRKLRTIGYRLYRADIGHSEAEHRREFMRRAIYALNFNDISGDYAEFGSHGGTTFAMAYGEIRRGRRARKLWAFDSFAGLPEQTSEEDYHPRWKKGKMATSLDGFKDHCRRNRIPDDAYETISGFYHDTLSVDDDSGIALPTDIALAYVDCDLHSSTEFVLEFLQSRLKHGMIIAFDDYFCFSDRTISGERKAFLDVFGKDERFQFLPYVQFGWHGMSFILEERKLTEADSD